jgi:hypothetical protein
MNSKEMKNQTDNFAGNSIFLCPFTVGKVQKLAYQIGGYS